MSSFKYVAFSELNEFLVPIIHFDWMRFIWAMPEFFQNDASRPISVYLFKSVLFPLLPKEFVEPSNNTDFFHILYPISLINLNRTIKPFSQTNRSRSITMARGIDEININNEHRLIYTYSVYRVPEEMGLDFRYVNKLHSRDQLITDRTMFAHYKTELLPRIYSRMYNHSYGIKEMKYG